MGDIKETLLLCEKAIIILGNNNDLMPYYKSNKICLVIVRHFAYVMPGILGSWILYLLENNVHKMMQLCCTFGELLTYYVITYMYIM